MMSFGGRDQNPDSNPVNRYLRDLTPGNNNSSGRGGGDGSPLSSKWFWALAVTLVLVGVEWNLFEILSTLVGVGVALFIMFIGHLLVLGVLGGIVVLIIYLLSKFQPNEKTRVLYDPYEGLDDDDE